MIPATYDIQYYRGDTYEFYIQPKDIDGMPIDVSTFTTAFLVATSRGPDPDASFSCTSSAMGSTIRCIIPAGVGATFVGNTVYVYDVQTTDPNTGVVRTYLTGNVYVTDQVEAALA